MCRSPAGKRLVHRSADEWLRAARLARRSAAQRTGEAGEGDGTAASAQKAGRKEEGVTRHRVIFAQNGSHFFASAIPASVTGVPVRLSFVSRDIDFR